MKKESKIERAVAIFKKAGGIHRRELYKLIDEGVLEVIERGLYRLKAMPEPSLPDFMPVAKKNPRSVICLISALAFHEITTQIPHFVYVALSRNARKPSITYLTMRYFWYSEKLLKRG